MPEADRLRWDARYREEGIRRREPSPFLVEADALLPGSGRAFDLAGGTGRNALWLARRGLDVTLVDISEVALVLARDQARASNVPLRTLPIDLEAEPFPQGPWDLIVSFDFLWRPIVSAVPGALAEGGLFVMAHPTRSNLSRHARPGEPYLLEDGELPRLVHGLEILRYDEGWTAEGRHEARLIGRRRFH